MGEFTIDETLSKEFTERVRSSGDFSAIITGFERRKNRWASKLTKNEIFDIWLKWELLEEGQWWTNLPRCPRKICVSKDGEPKNPNILLWDDPAKAMPWTKYLYHPGAVFEMRSNVSFSPCGNQCMYDENGDIILKIPTAGSADFRRPDISYSKYIAHKKNDIEPFSLADDLGRERDYFLVRPKWVEDN